MSKVHEYRSELRWNGSTADGYDAYARTHVVRVPPADGELTLSSDPAFRGDPALANPEQLLLAAASSCQLLSFLALAARSRVVVLAYEDSAVAEMPEDVSPMRITRIVLSPRVVVADGTDAARVHKLLERAHDACFVANTLNAEMRIAATVEVGERQSS